jgi:hypothetical protein
VEAPLGFFGGGVFYGLINGEKVLQAGYGYYGNGLRRQRRETELFALIAAADEERNQRADARRIEKTTPLRSRITRCAASARSFGRIR